MSSQSMQSSSFQTPPKLPLQASLGAKINNTHAKINNNLAEICELAKDVTFQHEKAQSALHVELAGHGRSLAVLKAEWAAKHEAMAKAMDDGLGNLAAEQCRAHELHDKRLEDHALVHARALEELQGELAEFRAALRADLDQQGKSVVELKAALQEHEKNTKTLEEKILAQSKAAWKEAHNLLSKAMADGHVSLAVEHSKLREEQARALEEHTSAQMRALEEHMTTHARALKEYDSAHAAKIFEMQQDIAGQIRKLNEGSSMLQQDMAELRSVLRSELAQHSENVAETRVAWQEQYTGLSKALDAARQEHANESRENLLKVRLELDGQSKASADAKAVWEQAFEAHASAQGKALEEHKEIHANALKDHKDAHATALEEHCSRNAATLAEMQAETKARIDKCHADNSALHDLQNKKLTQHTTALDEGLAEFSSRLHQELAALQLDHANNQGQTMKELNRRFGQLTLDMVDLAKNVNAAQEEAHSALRLELTAWRRDATEVRTAWEERHAIFLKERFLEQAQALEKHVQAHDKQLDTVQSNFDQELKALQAGHENGQKQLIDDMADQFDKLTWSTVQLAKDVAAAQEKLQSALRSELAVAVERSLNKSQQELATLRLETARNLEQASKDMTGRVNKLGLSMVDLGKNMAEAQKETHSSLALQLEEMTSAWESSRTAMSKALEESSATQARKIEEVRADMRVEIITNISELKARWTQSSMDVVQESLKNKG